MHIGTYMQVLWIFIGLLLTGCATYVPKPIAPEQVASRFSARSLEAPGLRNYLQQQLGREFARWPLVAWDRDMLILAAFYYSPVLNAAQAQEEAAQAAIDSADTSPNPALQFPFEYALNHDGSGRPITTGPALDWTIETADKRPIRIALARMQAEAAHWNTLQQAWQMRSQIRGAMLSAIAAERHSALLSDKVALDEALIVLWKHRLVAGAATSSELQRFEISAMQSRTELVAAQQRKDEALTRLATAMGLPLAALSAVRLDWSDYERAPVLPAEQDAQKAALAYRADLRAALVTYETAQAALQLEVARQYPDVHLGLGYTYDAGTNKISLGLAGVTLPLPSTRRGSILQAEARRKELAAQFDALQGAMSNDVVRALERVRACAIRVGLLDRQLALAARQREHLLANLNAGLSDRFELLHARLAYQSVALNREDAMLILQESAGQLEDAMQRPLPITTVQTMAVFAP